MILCDECPTIKSKVMLSNISWNSYLTAAALILAVWYGFVIFKYYRQKIREILKGNLKSKIPNGKQAESSSPFSEYNESFSTLEDAEELYSKLLNVIIESDERGISKAEFKNYLRFVLAEFPFVKKSQLREKINSLMVSECSKHPQLILTYPEMDGLWDETVS
jgi:hypothetical protein